MQRTEEVKTYLTNKHKGGSNNQKGGLFEDFYAVYQIVSCIARYKSSFEGVAFQTQLEDTFVDDLLIAHPDQNVYHQLKNTQSLSWGDVDKKGDIAFDFAHQIEDCEERKETFALKLVHSLLNSKVGEQIPDAIKEKTSVEYFDYAEDLNRLVHISTPLKDALAAISPNEASTDELANVAAAFLGVWRGCDTNHRISLQDIITKVEAIERVNLNIYPDVVMDDRCKSILDSFAKLDYHLRGRMFYWSVGCMSGSCPWSDEKEAGIVRQHPADIWELIAMLS